MIAFEGTRRIALGPLAEVVVAAKVADLRGLAGALVVFDVVTSERIELDLRGSIDEVAARAIAHATAHATAVAAAGAASTGTSAPGDASANGIDSARGRGRPRLGVIGREVTLLPRHWEWLGTQPGGASAALRRLVDQARVANAGKDRVRRAQESAYRFITTTLGGQPGFEEATRALFGDDRERFLELSGQWPADLRDHARRLADTAFTPDGPHDA